MNQISEFFGKLFETTDWPARWVCGNWSDFHGWLYISSDLAIWLAYFIIPVTIVWFIQKKRDVQFLPVFWLFGAFIILCGATHLIDALMFYWPAYRINGLMRFLTAIVSFATIFALIRDLPKALELKPPANFDEQDLQTQLALRDKKINSLEIELAKLKDNREKTIE